MATETDRPHRKSARELRETGWKMAKAGKAREGIKYLRQARAMDDQEARRVEEMKARADAGAKATRRDNKVKVEDQKMYRRDI